MKKLQTLRGVRVVGKKILLRVDFNCPIEDGKVSDTYRIERSLETFRYLLAGGAKRIVVFSYLGRPGGKWAKELSLRPVVEAFKEALAREKLEKGRVKLVDFSENIDDCVREAEKIEEGIIFFENIRFWPEEKAKDESFFKKLAGLGELYVNDAFSVCHRDEGTITGIPQVVPGVAGFLLEEELEKIGAVLEKPKRPAIAIVGGAKLETKIPVLVSLAAKYDKVLVGGLISIELQGKKKAFLEKLPKEKIVLPSGYANGEKRDIDEASAQKFGEIVGEAKTILWNGPMGMFEKPPFDKGSRLVGEAIAEAKAYKLVGGGETNEMLKEFGLFSKMDFVSTGGGAMLELISGNKLPGVEALKNRKD